jgi:hypothetical protein
MVKRLTPNPADDPRDGRYRRACRSYGQPLADARRDRRRQIPTVACHAFTLGGPDLSNGDKMANSSNAGPLTHLRVHLRPQIRVDPEMR